MGTRLGLGPRGQGTVTGTGTGASPAGEGQGSKAEVLFPQAVTLAIFLFSIYSFSTDTSPDYFGGS